MFGVRRGAILFDVGYIARPCDHYQLVKHDDADVLLVLVGVVLFWQMMSSRLERSRIHPQET